MRTSWFAAFLLIEPAALLACGDGEGPVQGIDVSHHQGPIDWAAVRKQGMAFAYVKATEGRDWVDRRHADNMREAREAGLLAGAYHFFSFCRDGAEQARNFLAHADIRAGDLVPVLDVETAGNCSGRPDSRRLHREVKAFLDTVEGAVGQRPLIYTTYWFHLRHMGREFDGERFWIRNLYWKPGRGIDWVFWQHAVEELPGVRGDVDRNEFAFGHHRLAEFTLKGREDVTD
jgi:lysozyme